MEKKIPLVVCVVMLVFALTFALFACDGSSSSNSGGTKKNVNYVDAFNNFMSQYSSWVKDDDTIYRRKSDSSDFIGFGDRGSYSENKKNGR